MTERKAHTQGPQPVETIGRLVTVWFRGQTDPNKCIPIPAEHVDWDYGGDPVTHYRIEDH